MRKLLILACLTLGVSICQADMISGTLNGVTGQPPNIGWWPTNASFTVATSSDVFFNTVYSPTSVSICGIGYSVGVSGAGSKVDFGVFVATSTTAVAKVASSSGTAIGAVGVSSVTFTSPANVSGLFYLAGYINEATNAQLGGVQASGSNQNFMCYRQTQVQSSTLPSSLTIPGTNGTKCFGMWAILCNGAIQR